MRRVVASGAFRRGQLTEDALKRKLARLSGSTTMAAYFLRFSCDSTLPTHSHWHLRVVRASARSGLARLNGHR